MDSSVATRMGSHAAPQTRPDPMRAHGAWVYLFSSIGGGALLATGGGVELALLVGTGFAGAFMCTAALAVGVRRRRRQLLVGMAAALLAPLLALRLDAEPVFLVVAAAAVVPAVVAVLAAARLGSLSRVPLVAGIAALVTAGVAAALAGGASTGRAVALFVLLWTVFCWRSLRIAEPLNAGGKWDREALRARGLREAGFAALWTLAVVLGIRFGLA